MQRELILDGGILLRLRIGYNIQIERLSVNGHDVRLRAVRGCTVMTERARRLEVRTNLATTLMNGCKKGRSQNLLNVNRISSPLDTGELEP